MNDSKMSHPDEGKKEIRNLVLFSTGKTISIFGASIFNFALGYYVLQLTGSALSFAVTLILSIIPMIIINPFAGVIADRVNKKKLAVAMELLNGMMLVIVYIVCLNYDFNLYVIYATVFMVTVFATFFGIGVEAAKPNMVSEKWLMNMNSISKIIDSISSIMGPMLGGVVFAFLDIRTFIIINGISFILSGLSTMFIDFKLFHNQSEEKDSARKIHFIRDIKEGFQYLLARKEIKRMIAFLITTNFFLGFGVTVPLPYIVNSILQLGSKEFGMIQAAFPIGMILGAIVVKRITEKIPYSILLNYLGFTLSVFILISGAPILFTSLQLVSIVYTSFYIVVMFILGLIISLIDIPLSFMLQREIPDEYRGRVLSISLSIGKMILPLAMVLSGVLLNYIPSYVIPATGGLLFLSFNIYFLNHSNIELTASKQMSN